MNIKEFFTTDTGKKTEAALWQVSVMIISIVIMAAGEFDIRWMIPLVPALQFLTKWINTTYIK